MAGRVQSELYLGLRPDCLEHLGLKVAEHDARQHPERAAAGVGKVDEVRAAVKNELGFRRVGDVVQHQGHGCDA